MSKFSGLVPAGRVAESPKGHKGKRPKAEAGSTAPSLSRSNPPRIGRPPAKRSDPSYVQVTAYVPRELYGETRARLFREGREFSSLVEELLQQWNKAQG